MKASIPYNFDVKYLVRSPSAYLRPGHFEICRVKMTTEVEIREITEDQAPVAVRVAGHIQIERHHYHLNSLMERRTDGAPIELRWFENGFWIDRGSVDLLAEPHSSWVDKQGRYYAQKPPFCDLAPPIEMNEPPVVRLDDLPAEKTCGKIEEKEDKARADAARLIAVAGRLYESCPEPVFVFHLEDGGAVQEFIGFGFAPVAPERDAKIIASMAYRDKAWARLTDAPPNLATQVDILLPEVFQSDLAPGEIMGKIREMVDGLRNGARFLPIAQLEAMRRLFAATQASWSNPTPEILEAAEEFVASGTIPHDDILRIEATHEYWRNGRDRCCGETSPFKASADVSAVVAQLPKLIAAMHRSLADRMFPESSHTPLPLRNGLGVLRRAETAGETLRAASIAGADAIELMAAARAGEVDVLLIDGPSSLDRWHSADSGKWRHFDGYPLHGVRIVRTVNPDVAEDYFTPNSDPSLRAAVAETSYPELVVAACKPELKL